MTHIVHLGMEWTAIFIDGIASIIMVLAFAVALFSFVRGYVGQAPIDRIRQIQIVRCEFGIKLTFALELMIVSDLLHTIVSRTLDDLIFLGALVAIRTLIAYFLGREIQEVEAEIRR